MGPANRPDKLFLRILQLTLYIIHCTKMSVDEVTLKKEKKARKKEQKRLAELSAQSTAASTPATSVISTPKETPATSDAEGIANGDEDAEAKKKRKAEKAAKKEAKRLKKRKLESEDAGDADANASVAEESAAPVQEPENVATVAVNSHATNGQEVPKKKRKKDNKVSSSGNVNGEAQKTSKPVSASTLSPAEIESFLTANAVSYEPSTSSATYPPILSFDNVPVSDGIRSGLKTFDKPTIVQSASWGVQLRPESGSRPRDCVAIAATG